MPVLLLPLLACTPHDAPKPSTPAPDTGVADTAASFVPGGAHFGRSTRLKVATLPSAA